MGILKKLVAKFEEFLPYAASDDTDAIERIISYIKTDIEHGPWAYTFMAEYKNTVLVFMFDEGYFLDESVFDHEANVMGAVKISCEETYSVIYNIVDNCLKNQ